MVLIPARTDAVVIAVILDLKIAQQDIASVFADADYYG
jgi:hypothetical protein